MKRLGIKKFYLYLIHGPNPNIPLKETMRAMNYLIENGLADHIGVSNFVSEQIFEAQSVSKYKIVNNQIHYNLAARAHEVKGTLDYCRANDVLITVVKSSDVNHLRENLDALGWKLESEDEKHLDDNFPRGDTMSVGVSLKAILNPNLK